MIDLHLHTTASDGRSTPEALVREAAAAGIRTLAVTDHDTVGAIRAVRAAAVAAGIAVVPGIEITAVDAGRDVHILGYFIDEDDRPLAEFLADQRRDRRRRVADIVERLAVLGMPVTLDLTASAPASARAQMLSGGAFGADRAVGRPLVAAALVEAGHARDIADAFDRFLSPGRPAFIPRRGALPTDVISRIIAAGGLASLAHPGKIGFDEAIPLWARAGLAGIEVFHPDHPDRDRARYRALANDLGLVVTGGSDYHGPGSGRSVALGRVTLPEDDFARLASAAAGARRT